MIGKLKDIFIFPLYLVLLVIGLILISIEYGLSWLFSKLDINILGEKIGNCDKATKN